jgi:hypothetical protein
MYLSNYQSGMQNMGQAVGRNQDVMTQQLFPSQIMSGVGGANRGMAQRQLDEEIRKFYAGQDLDLTQAQQTMGLLAGMPGGTGTSTVTGVAPQSSLLSTLLGLGTTAVGGAAGPFGAMAGKGAASALSGGK